MAFFTAWNAAAPAFAAEKAAVPSVAIVGFRSTDHQAEGQARNDLMRKLEGSRRIRLVPNPVTAKYVDEVWEGEKGEAAAALDQALKNFKEGKLLYEKLALEESVAALNRSVRGYREGIAALRDNTYLLLSHLYLGISLAAMGREAEGKRYIRKMIVLDPARKGKALPQRDFPPKVVSLHKTLTEEVLRGPVGDLEVDVKPAGAAVFFDGVPQQGVPLVIPGVPTGEHFIAAEMKGRRVFSKKVLIGPGTNKISVELEDWQPLAPYAAERRKSGAADLLSGLAGRLEAQVLLLGRAEVSEDAKATLTAQLYDARSHEFSRIERADAPAADVKKASETLARKLLSDLTKQGLVIADIGTDGTKPPVVAAEKNIAAAPVPAEHSSEKAIYQRWWFWTLVGLALAGGGLGVYMATRKSDYHVLNVQNPLVP